MRTLSSRSPWQRAYAAASSSGLRRSPVRLSQATSGTPTTRPQPWKPRGPTPVPQFADDSHAGSFLSTHPAQGSPQCVNYQGLHDHGLQLIPEATKYRYAARACSSAERP